MKIVFLRESKCVREGEGEREQRKQNRAADRGSETDHCCYNVLNFIIYKCYQVKSATDFQQRVTT